MAAAAAQVGANGARRGVRESRAVYEEIADRAARDIARIQGDAAREAEDLERAAERERNGILVEKVSELRRLRKEAEGELTKLATTLDRLPRAIRARVPGVPDVPARNGEPNGTLAATPGNGSSRSLGSSPALEESEGVRLLAAHMAAQGSDPKAIARRLRREFGVDVKASALADFS